MRCASGVSGIGVAETGIAVGGGGWLVLGSKVSW